MNQDEIRRFAGGWNFKSIGGRQIFSEEVFEFFEDLSEEIRNTPEISNNPEVMAFAFWVRRRHLQQWMKEIDIKNRMGWGMMFHIASSNVPMLFAYSMAFGMLTGNGNVIRVSRKITQDAEILCEIIDQVMRRKKYEEIFRRNLIITYEKNDKLTEEISLLCDGRILWGGDDTAQQFQSIRSVPGSVNFVFPDRASIGIFDAVWMAERTDEELEQIAYGFYNDTLQMDQNACSSPKVIFWVGREQKQREAVCSRWWNIFSSIAKQYDLTDQKAYEKYEQVCKEIMDGEKIESVQTYENYVYVLKLKTYPEHPEEYKGKFGCFYQYSLDNVQDICQCLNRKIQTVVYAGIEPQKLADAIIESGQKGGDRLVPVGQALNLHWRWDGKNLIHGLSRVIDVR